MLTADQHGSLGAWRGSTPAFPVYDEKMENSFLSTKTRSFACFVVSIVSGKFISLSVGCLQFPLKRKNKKSSLLFNIFVNNMKYNNIQMINSIPVNF
jgi:hypothetical protein